MRCNALNKSVTLFVYLYIYLYINDMTTETVILSQLSENKANPRKITGKNGKPLTFEPIQIEIIDSTNQII